MGAIAGNTSVNPCALFCGVGGIKLHGRNKGRCKRLYGAAWQQEKNKSPAPLADARQKKSPASVGGVEMCLLCVITGVQRVIQCSCC